MTVISYEIIEFLTFFDKIDKHVDFYEKIKIPLNSDWVTIFYVFESTDRQTDRRKLVIYT